MELNPLDQCIEYKLESKLSDLYNDDIRSILHSLYTVYYARLILKDEASKNPDITKDDEIIVVSAAYLHDIGNVGLLKKGYTYDDKRKAKIRHMSRGAKLANRITKELGFTINERDKISYLVRTHDRLDYLTTIQQRILMEGDSLSMIDYKNVLQTFNKNELDRFLRKYKGRRGAMFETDKGKELRDKLYPQALEFCSKMYK